jgi:chitinase
MKTANPALKTLIAIGGWNQGDQIFSTVASNSILRTKFVNSIYTFVKTYGFNGVDFDWEYPAQRGGIAADKVISTIDDFSTFQIIYFYYIRK